MRRRPVCILCMLLVVFLCVTDWLGFSLIRGNPLPQSVQTWIRKHPESTICGEVVRCRENEDFQSVYLRNTYLIYNSEKVSIDNIKVYLKQKKNHSVNSDVDKLLAGSLVLVSGKLEEVQSPTNPGEFDSKAYYGCQRIYYVMKKGKIKKQSQSHSVYGQFLIDMQQKFAGILEKTCGMEAGAFEAIVLGDKTNLDPELKMRYQMAGIIHILAVSGLHISLLGMGLYNLLKKIGLGIWPLVQEGMDVLNRKKRSEVNEKGKIRDKLLMSFLASGVVQLTTLPIVLWFYGEVSVMGIFLNLLVLPTVGIVLGSGTAGALLGLVTVRGAFLAVVPGRIILRGYEFLTVLLGRLSFCTWIGGKPEVWQIVGYYLVLATAVWMYRAGVMKSENGKIFAWKIRAVYAGMVCFAILLISYRPHENFRIACLDVGQGDGIVVEIENRWSILIDGGSTNKNELGKYQLLPYLKSRGISRLDGIYVSHTDEDHISGVRELLEFVEKDLTSLRIENLILPKWSDIQENKNYRELTELAESAGVRVLTVKAGDEIRYGTVRLKVLWPESTASGREVNEDAMVLEMISKDFKGLFTGDIGMVTEEKLIQNGCLEDVDFLKTAHHGSRYSTGAEFLEIVRPELAVVSCSATNTYGHPSPDTLERLKKSGSRVLITRDCGAVTIVNGKSVSVFNRIK